MYTHMGSWGKLRPLAKSSVYFIKFSKCLGLQKVSADMDWALKHTRTPFRDTNTAPTTNHYVHVHDNRKTSPYNCFIITVMISY
jgi:hypothetical protein